MTNMCNLAEDTFQEVLRKRHLGDTVVVTEQTLQRRLRPEAGASGHRSERLGRTLGLW